LLISWGDPGGEEPDPRQPLGADELAAPLLDLALEVGVGHAQPARVMSLNASASPCISSPVLSSIFVVERPPGHPPDAPDARAGRG